MILNVSKEFNRKLQIPQYPIKGFWYSLGSTNMATYYLSWISANSDIYRTNTFIKDGKCRVSFQLTNSNDIDNSKDMIYLYAIDMTLYSDISDTRVPLYSADTEGEHRIYNHLAAIIFLEDNDKIDWTINNIFDLNLNIKCSFNTINEPNQVQVEHYNSYNVNKMSIYDENTKNLQFIDKLTALDKVQESLSYSEDEQLNGSMMIKKSGLIQL